MATLDGNNVFGVATRFRPTFDPTAQQINEFFGVSGLQSLFGGERGFTLMISGVFFDTSPAGVINQEGLLLSYRDGIARTIVDNYGRTYPDCVFTSQYQQHEIGLRPAVFLPSLTYGWCLPYQCVFKGL